MSSTNRGACRIEKDYYRTPIYEIEKFLHVFNKDIMELDGKTILDPCAGGDQMNAVMPYPFALEKYTDGFNQFTIDIREDSPARVHCDYLTKDIGGNKFDLIISNPPFSLAQEFIDKALKDVVVGGYVVMFLPLNYLGTDKRRDWWLNKMPKYICVHSHRPSFTPDGKTDSREYAHFIWQKPLAPQCSKLFII